MTFFWCLLNLLLFSGGSQPHARAVMAGEATSSPSAAQAVAFVSQGEGMAQESSRHFSIKRGSRVNSGWVLACKQGSTLVLCYNDKHSVTLKPADGTYTVPSLPLHAGPFDSVLGRGGLKQAAGSSVFSPPPDGRVQPLHFVFRWAPLPKGSALKLILRRWPPSVGDDNVLWGKSVTEDGTGTYDSPDAREALTQLRAQYPTAKVEFTLVTPDEETSTVIFRLLSKEDEERLPKDLGACDGDDPLVRHIERASVFQHAELYTEAADEMEQALEASPDSTDLRIATIWAEQRTGNLARVEAHRKRLPPGTQVAGD